jgi:two-component system, OmpR family, KDP operon response regulator KdpE
MRLRVVDYEAVLLDINMPGIGGIETCRRIRRIYTKIPILILTVRFRIAFFVRFVGLGDE